MIGVRRVQEDPSPDDGLRVLVDRLWPRGMTKERAAVDVWLKEVAPSTELRKLFHHEHIAFSAFDELRGLVAEHDVVTLLYAARDEQHNHALLLRDRLQRSTGERD